jgi:hypothetical protein
LQYHAYRAKVRNAKASERARVEKEELEKAEREGLIAERELLMSTKTKTQ